MASCWHREKEGKIMELTTKNTEIENRAKVIKSDILKLGAAAPRYSGGESADSLRAYFRINLEPFLRHLKKLGYIRDFRIGISPVFFWHPKLRIYFNRGQFFELPLDRIYPVKRIFKA